MEKKLIKERINRSGLNILLRVIHHDACVYM